MYKNHLLIREGVTTITYYRKPTASEIRFGYGAIHYRDFPLKECIKDGKLRKWILADDGLRYYL